MLQIMFATSFWFAKEELHAEELLPTSIDM
jgi:hypothetical protein